MTKLTDVNGDVLQGIQLGKSEEITYTSSGNAKVMGWIVKPPSFDPSKKYPLILEIHGGPFGNYNVGFNYMFQNFAANGFVVLVTNPRGSTGYGSDFINGIDHNYPGPDYDDLMAGVDTVVGKGYVDTSRMYVSGCSGGGVLSSWVIGHTDRFAAAAVRCPVIDWLSMAGHTDIPLFTYSFFKKPFWEDPSDWLSHSSLMSVGKVTTPTLLMTGVLDRRTPMPQTEEYYAALKVKGVPVKLLQFNEEYHGTGSKPSNYIRTQLYMMSWFNQWTRAAGGTRVDDGASRRRNRTADCIGRRIDSRSARRVGARPERRCAFRSRRRRCSAPSVAQTLDRDSRRAAARSRSRPHPHQPDHPRLGHKITDVGPNVAIPAGAQIIDLSRMTVMPGLVEAHNHLALTYKPEPENNIYYYTYVQESTALRAIQAASNGIQMLASGFTIVRDMGNNALYADTALRQAIEQGWIPGTDDHQLRDHHRRHGRTVLPDAGDGAAAQHRLSGIPRRRHAGRNRQGGAAERAVRRAGDQDLRRLQAVRLHRRRDPSVHPRSRQGRDESRRPRADAERREERDRGRHLVDRALDRAERGDAHADGAEGHLPRRHRHAGHARRPSGVAAGVSADRREPEGRLRQEGAADVFHRRRLLRRRQTRGEVCIEFLKTWKDAGIPNADILRAMTINGYKVSQTEKTRGPIKAGFFADLIAVPGIRWTMSMR